MDFHRFADYKWWKEYVDSGEYESENDDGDEATSDRERKQEREDIGDREDTQTPRDQSLIRHRITTATTYAFGYAILLVLMNGSIGLVELIGALFAGVIMTIILN